MNKFLRMAMLLVFMVTAMACKKEGTDPDPILEIANSDLVQEFNKETEKRTVTVECNQEYTAISSKPDWCKPTVDGNLRIEVLANPDGAQRTATLTVSTKGLDPVKIEVIQFGTDPLLEVEEEEEGIQLYADNEEFSLTVKTNVSIAFETETWITLLTTGTPADRIYKFRAGEIPEGETSREGKIVVKSTDSEVDPVTVKVTQSKDTSPLRFAVISDIHFGNSLAKTKVSRALDVLLNRSGSVNALFVVGDLTDSGTDDQYNDLNEVFDRDIPEGFPVYYMMGNHDHITSNGVERYKTKLKQEVLHQYVKIKGYPFITISMKAYDSNMGYDTESKNFLKASLEDAAGKFPGKPIFVFSHIPVDGTIFGTHNSSGPWGADGNWGGSALKSILQEYPQVVYFSGHLHYTIADQRSIWQDTFTAISDGGTYYAEKPSDMDDGNKPDHYMEVTEGLVVEILANGDVEVSRWDTYRKEEILPKWTVKAPHDGSAFHYKDYDGGEAPVFKTGDVPTISEITSTSCRVTFPQATDNDAVYGYKIVIADSDGENVSEAKIFSLHYLNSHMPATRSWQMNSLAPGTSYVARVTAIDAYGNESSPIFSEDFVMTDFVPDPSVTAPIASLFNIGFRTDGAYDISAMGNVVEEGQTSPATSFDPELNMYKASFVADAPSWTYNYYKLDYSQNSTIKDALLSEYSLEAYFRTANTSNSCPVSAMESGGMGIDLTYGTNNIGFYSHIGGDYVYYGSGVYASNTDFDHVVITYSKSEGVIKGYVNGLPAGSVSASGTPILPPQESARWFGIGGDAYTDDWAQYSFTGDIAFTRLYNKAVSVDEAYRLYEQIENRKQMTNIDTMVSLLENEVAQAISNDPDGTANLQAVAASCWNLVNDLKTTQVQIDNMLSALEMLLP